MSDFKRTAVIDEDLDNFFLSVPYDRNFIDELKELVPSDERTWDSAQQMWTINLDYEQDVIDLCNTHFDEVKVND